MPAAFCLRFFRNQVPFRGRVQIRKPCIGIKRFVDPELIISRKEIIEITDYKIIVKDEEKTLKSRAAKEDFIPNFVNPFRTQGQELSSTKTDDQD